jgi:hypothetical protein
VKGYRNEAEDFDNLAADDPAWLAFDFRAEASCTADHAAMLSP